EAAFGDGVFEGEADFRIAFDAEEGEAVDELPFESLTPDEQEDNQDEDKQDEEEEPSKPEPSGEVTKGEIDYIIKHESDDKPSSADSFFEKPGKLIEKDGSYYLEVTVKNWSMI